MNKLGPKPDAMDIDAYPEDGDYYFDMMCWERHRAEKAEELLREAFRDDLVCEGLEHKKWADRVAAHFQEVKP